MLPTRKPPYMVYTCKEFAIIKRLTIHWPWAIQYTVIRTQLYTQRGKEYDSLSLVDGYSRQISRCKELR